MRGSTNSVTPSTKALRLLAFPLALLATLVAAPVLAETTGWRQVTVVSCHVDDESCSIYISGSKVGPPLCYDTNLSFHIDDPNGRETLMLLASALHTGKLVNIEFSQECFDMMPQYPKLTSVRVMR